MSHDPMEAAEPVQSAPEAPKTPAKAPPPSEVRFPLTAEDLTIVLWLIEGVWSTGNVESLQQASYLVGLDARIRGVLAQAKPPQKPAGGPKAP